MFTFHAGDDTLFSAFPDLYRHGLEFSGELGEEFSLRVCAGALFHLLMILDGQLQVGQVCCWRFNDLQ